LFQNSTEAFECFPFSVEVDPQQGRFVRAVRDIQPGEVILVSSFGNTNLGPFSTSP
jgi:hypothetical protein